MDRQPQPTSPSVVVVEVAVSWLVVVVRVESRPQHLTLLPQEPTLLRLEQVEQVAQIKIMVMEVREQTQPSVLLLLPMAVVVELLMKEQIQTRMEVAVVVRLPSARGAIPQEEQGRREVMEGLLLFRQERLDVEVEGQKETG
jgi:hypothetical protein